MRFLLPFLMAALLRPVMAMAPPPGPGVDQLPAWAVQLAEQPACVRDRLMIRLRPEALPSRRLDRAQLDEVPAMAAFAQSRGLRDSRPLMLQELDQVARESGLDRDLVLEFSPGIDLATEQAAWAARPEVEWAEFDWLVRAMLVPNDGYFSGQWALRNTGQNPPGGTVDCDIDAELAWDVYTGSTAVKIAILDTGVDLNHPDLQSKIIAGYDYVNGDSTPDDDNMHGTACASLAAALTNNTVGMSGVDWNARIMPLKVLNAAGSGSTTNIINAVDWARTHGANVISMSLGGGSFSSSFNTAINNAYNAGIPVVCAAGNDNSSVISYPAAYTNSMAIGALSPCNQRKSPSSCDGENWWGSNYGTGLDVLSPGVLLRSATINTYINNMNGTSGATPQVAGLAALMRGLNASLTAQQIYDIIDDTADDLGAAGWDSQTGWGRLNAHQALLAANPDPCLGETVVPVITHTALPNTTNNSLPYAVSGTVTDNCTLATVTLRWQVNGGAWSSVAMSNAASVYSGAIPAQAYGSVIHYQIVAVDASANTATGDWTFQVINPCDSDILAPTLSMLSPITDTSDTAGPYIAVISATDPCGISAVSLTYQVDGGVAQGGTVLAIGGGEFEGEIPGQAAGSVVSYTFWAEDNSVNFNTSSGTWSFNVLTTPIDQAPVVDIDWLGPGQVQLSWTAVPGATFYRLYSRPALGGAWSFLQNVAGTSATLPVLDNQTLLFRVTAAN